MSPVNQNFSLLDFVPYRLLSAASRASSDLAKVYSKEYKVDVPQWRILLHLNTEDKISVRDIEKRVDMERSKISRAVDRLAKSGLVLKSTNPEDRRLIIVELTDSGKALAFELEKVAAAYQSRIEDRLGDHLAPLTEALDILLKD